MKKILFFSVLLSGLFQACGDDVVHVPMCECKPDEYCVDDKCFKMNANVAPAPDELAEDK